MENLDPHIIFNTIVSLAFVEAILKPVTVRYTRKLMELLYKRVDWIPDWLYQNKRCKHDEVQEVREGLDRHQ